MCVWGGAGSPTVNLIGSNCSQVWSVSPEVPVGCSQHDRPPPPPASRCLVGRMVSPPRRKVNCEVTAKKRSSICSHQLRKHVAVSEASTHLSKSEKMWEKFNSWKKNTCRKINNKLDIKKKNTKKKPGVFGKRWKFSSSNVVFFVFVFFKYFSVFGGMVLQYFSTYISSGVWPLSLTLAHSNVFHFELVLCTWSTSGS